jgi:hypothetical protein
VPLPPEEPIKSSPKATKPISSGVEILSVAISAASFVGAALLRHALKHAPLSAILILDGAVVIVLIMIALARKRIGSAKRQPDGTELPPPSNAPAQDTLRSEWQQARAVTLSIAAFTVMFGLLYGFSLSVAAFATRIQPNSPPAVLLLLGASGAIAFVTFKRLDATPN